MVKIEVWIASDTSMCNRLPGETFCLLPRIIYGFALCMILMPYNQVLLLDLFPPISFHGRL